jgi:hypothetical protein
LDARNGVLFGQRKLDSRITSKAAREAFFLQEIDDLGLEVRLADA